MPPSDNKIYFNHGGARIKTKEATRFENDVSEVMSGLAMSSKEEFEDNVPYSMTIIVYFKAVLNKSWPKKAKRRFKKLDCMNRQKLVTDCVMKCIGIDDRTIFDQRVIKRVDKDNPRIVVSIRRM
jgi:Holliday junction resolvase RusA-like endonuclease